MIRIGKQIINGNGRNRSIISCKDHKGIDTEMKLSIMTFFETWARRKCVSANSLWLTNLKKLSVVILNETEEESYKFVTFQN